jgi:hypothetical protein
MKFHLRWLLAGVLLALTGCGGTHTATPVPAATGASSTEQPTSPSSAPPAEQPANQDPDTALTNPFCELATLAEVQAVIGGRITKIEVIDVPDLTSLSCVYLDEQNVSNGLTIDYHTTEKLVATNSQWTTAAAYFAEWTRSEEPVAGLGDGAAWVDITTSLWVLKGDTVIQIGASSLESGNPDIRTKVNTLAGQVVSRLP